MLGIAERAGQFGANAGTGLGGVLGGALGMVGDVLGAPRRLLMQSLGLPETGAEVMGHLGMDQEGLPAQSLGMLLEMATDPLTYAGGLIGRLGGRAAGALAGGKLEAQALARGPRFEGGLEKLGAIPKMVEDQGFKRLVGQTLETPPGYDVGKAILNHPEQARILQEIPPGSTMFPHSNNALAFKTPQGDVLRIGTEARANIPEMLQPTRSVRVGDLNVERLPFASEVGGLHMRPKAEELGDLIASRGLKPIDLHHHNVGIHQGQPKLIDPGTVRPTPEMPTGAQLTPPSGGGLGDRLLDLMGADDRVREHLMEQATPSQLDRLTKYVRADRGPLSGAAVTPVSEARLAKFTPQHLRTAPMTPVLPEPPPTLRVPQGPSITGGLDPDIEAIIQHIRDKPTLRTAPNFHIEDTWPNFLPRR